MAGAIIMMIFGSQFTARVVSADLNLANNSGGRFKRRSFLHPVGALTTHGALPYKLYPARDRLELTLNLPKRTLYTSIRDAWREQRT
jgi:hypothetical protein